MLNVANSEFGTKIYCDRPTEKHYPVQNLLKADGCGFICPPVIAPPVNVLFCLPEAVELHLIVVKPYVRRHRVGSFSIFLRRETGKEKRSVKGNSELMHCFGSSMPLVTVNLDDQTPETVVAFYLQNTRTVPTGSLINSASNVHEAKTLRVFSPGQCRVRSMLLRINRMASANFSLCLGAVELWCLNPRKPNSSPLPSIEPDTAYLQPQDALSDDETPQVPEDFVDPVTGDLMTDPVRLPSGVRVNRNTLVRFYTERLRAQPGAETRPVDPFTMVPFDEDEVQSDVELKAAIVEHLERCNHLKDLCARLDNHSFPLTQPTIPFVPQISSDSDSDPNV